MSPQLALVFVGLGAGYLARRLRRYPEVAADVLNRFVIDVCVPAMILLLVPKLRMRWDLSLLVLMPWALALVSYWLTRVASRLLRLDRGATAALFLCTGLGNTSFLGFPLCSALLGESSVPLAAVYDQLGSFLLLSIVAPLVIARAGGHTAPDARSMAKRVLGFPPFVALVIAVLAPTQQPGWLSQMLKATGDALIPVAMFAEGLRLRVTPPKQLGAFGWGLVVKLALMPLLAFIAVRALASPRDVSAVAVVESAMPAMVSAGAMAMAEGFAPELAAALVGWGILIAQLTVPAWAALMR